MPEPEWSHAGDAPSTGPRVWCCHNCAGRLRPHAAGRAGPTLGKYMLANDNWGGMLHRALRECNALELLFLGFKRTCRRRFFCGDVKRGTTAMPAVIGTSVIAPCASGLENALR